MLLLAMLLFHSQTGLGLESRLSVHLLRVHRLLGLDVVIQTQFHGLHFQRNLGETFGDAKENKCYNNNELTKLQQQ